jgi:hypothetical protein
MVSLGYDTLICAPPVKNGFTNWRSGVIMIMGYRPIFGLAGNNRLPVR